MDQAALMSRHVQRYSSKHLADQPLIFFTGTQHTGLSDDYPQLWRHRCNEVRLPVRAPDGWTTKKKENRTKTKTKTEKRAPARKRMRYFSVVVFRLRPSRDPATDVPGRRPRPGLRPSSIVAGADSDASSCVQSSSSFAASGRVETRNERERNTGRRRGSDKK